MSRLQHWRWRHWAKTGRPIIIGPWRSEVGFETLYWLPWLAKWRETYGISKDRLIVVTRGGAGIWYDAAQTVELYDYVPLERLRKAMLADSQASGSVKQQRMTPWEDALLRVVAHDLGLRRYHVLHPSVIYNGLAPWWQGDWGLTAIQRQLAFGPLPVPHPPLNLPLPEKFVAVRFYARHTWPMTEEHQTWVTQLVERLSQKIPVVNLSPNLATDDHVDFALPPSVLTIHDHVTPQTNLAVQSAVLAKAAGFVGTYGGTMQLAVRLKKPAVGVYHQFGGTAYAHKVLTEAVAVQQQTPLFIGRPTDAQYVAEVML